MTDPLFWPYDEVDVFIEDDKVVVKAPWIEIRVEKEGYDLEALEVLLSRFRTNQFDPAEDLELIQWFFEDFAAYPICYVLPTPKTSATDQHHLKDQELLNLELKPFIQRFLPDQFDIASVMSLLNHQDWNWDTDASVALAQTEVGIHPESLLSVAKRFHHLEVFENQKSEDIFKDIEKFGSDSFQKASSILVRQNHYVTENCQTALAPALEIAQSAVPAVKEFMNEENGHDLILGVAIKSMSENPTDVPVTSQTQLLMKLLEEVASRNFLGFAMAVDAFERSSYEEVDPLAKLLMKGGFDKAAKQINRHMDINDAGGHENIAVGFLERMSHVKPDYAKEALRFAEAITHVMNSIILSSIEEFKKQN